MDYHLAAMQRTETTRRWLNESTDESTKHALLGFYDNIYSSSPLSASGAETRIFKLLPVAYSAPLRDQVYKIALSESTNYEALSYTWGTSTKRVPITLNDCEKFPVTYNLHCALRWLRLSESERHLWIDAISIDQASLTERAEQVKLIGRIFSTAADVLVCLGESPEPG